MHSPRAATTKTAYSLFCWPLFSPLPYPQDKRIKPSVALSSPRLRAFMTATRSVAIFPGIPKLSENVFQSESTVLTPRSSEITVTI